MKRKGASAASQRFVPEQWPHEPKLRRVNGWPMHYIDEGAKGIRSLAWLIGMICCAIMYCVAISATILR
jgi:hypothetical protein